ncbi:MarR family winged helix-turn-helix transcriptional regulator [Pseudonocardia sp. TRM90224]|uniref:MarR family winged helix-turn-helix transcriptional regulator n=1 Tax=Pseudonocardia sp. TRM90224 TaxID=2812678 RepID=UPI001E53A7D1|nr:MarR family transcriptional regulator [Pseudonocardia sp. TRM90224]
MSSVMREQIGVAVQQFIASAVLNSQAIAQRVGLGASDSQFLTLLQLHGPLTPGQLAELSRLTTGTVTGVIDRLEKGGYVRRERDSGDRRKVIVTIVPEGMASMVEHYRGYAEEMDAILRRRSPQELQVIADFFVDVLGEERRGREEDHPDATG